MSGKQIVIGEMWSVTNFGDAGARYHAFLNDRRAAAKRVIECLVTHDKIFIPTDDYLSLAILVTLLGERRVLSLFDQNALGIVRLKGAMAYVGGGAGLRAFQVQNKEGGPKPFCAPMDEAINWALAPLREGTFDTNLVKAAMDATIELSGTVINDEIRRESFNDVASSPTLQRLVGTSIHDLDRLGGIGADQVTIYGGESPDDVSNPIGALLRVAHTNLEMRMAEAAVADDISTSCPIGLTLKAKADRALSESPYHTWATLREIASLPDFAGTVLDDEDRLDKLLKLRNSAHGREFRRWYHEACRNNSTTTGREYANLLKKQELGDGFLAKTIRFVMTTALDLKFGDITGAISGAADSFVLDRLIRRPSAKIFLDRLEQFKPL